MIRLIYSVYLLPQLLCQSCLRQLRVRPYQGLDQYTRGIHFHHQQKLIREVTSAWKCGWNLLWFKSTPLDIPTGDFLFGIHLSFSFCIYREHLNNVLTFILVGLGIKLCISSYWAFTAIMKEFQMRKQAQRPPVINERPNWTRSPWSAVSLVLQFHPPPMPLPYPHLGHVVASPTVSKYYTSIIIFQVKFFFNQK